MTGFAGAFFVAHFLPVLSWHSWEEWGRMEVQSQSEGHHMGNETTGRAMGSHQSARALSDIWLTPPEILEALGPFDLDPCASLDRPWDTAAKHYTIEDDGLAQQWEGSVWMNPPYGFQAAVWLERLAEHGDGIALVFARTETRMFFDHVWPKASALLFIKGRLYFRQPDGSKAKYTGGAPSVLIAYGDQMAERLRLSGIEGAFVDQRKAVAA